MKIRFLLLLSILPLLSCREALTKPDEVTPVAVPIEFDAAAYGANATLNIQIYDTNTQGVYYQGTTTGNTYSGQTDIVQGTSVTFKVTANANTNISTQISSNNKVVASGTFNPAQQMGAAPVSVLYYKVQ